MKKIINLTLLAIALMAVACHKEATLTKLPPVAFTATVSSSASQVILTAATDDTPDVLTLKWGAVTYPVKAHVTYTVQADIPADTVGSSAWSNAKSILAGSDVLTKTFKGSDLNALAISVGITGNDTAKMVFRIQAYQDRNAFSKAVTVTVSPYVTILPPSDGYPVLYLPGFYQGWSPGTAGTVAAPTAGVYNTPGVYEGYVNMPASTDGSAYHFKFTSAPDWNHINYGNGGAGILTTDGTAGDLVLPGPGIYELWANPTTLTWGAAPITWSIIGDATPGGWTGDTQMAYNAAKGVWTVTANMIKNGSFKFRANNDWKIDFGIVTATGKIYYADNPAFGGNKQGLDNLTVPSDGNYTLTLDLHDPNNYHYTAHKN
ncbi:SusE domain-containing protein [Mucilaginibacter sp. BJC16-A38]|uniref:SusE domain-containing protein n=1 Tax=Mucilaginibacter phenanthrenivorans TaxID=1234842 RepID=UPI0021576A56|nr:SusE domain-containing protein [Mucilaginibacter phenanthrenivorans]MCR8558098.1 SusE domain-containing protein [Mucilaginibacter phenanthrenivorans]